MALNKYSLLIVLMVFVAACLSCSQVSDPPQEHRTFPELFDKGLQAHGGLAQWNKYGTFSFTEVSGSDTSYYIVDLKNRNERIEQPGKFKVGFTEDEMFVYPHKDSFPGDDPKFYHNLRFYFLALPFVTADPGANHIPLSPGTLEGKMYNRLKVTYDEGIGVASKDQYILWYDPTTNVLEYINYSVTYFDEAKADQYNAIGYEGWTEVGGLLMPSTMVGYRWEGDSLGAVRYRRDFMDMKFDEERPEPNIFTELE